MGYPSPFYDGELQAFYKRVRDLFSYEDSGNDCNEVFEKIRAAVEARELRFDPVSRGHQLQPVHPQFIETARKALAVVEILRIEAHERSFKSGFWDGQDRHHVTVQLAKLALIGSECVGEAVEAVRDGHETPSKKIPDHTQLAEELADTVIRIADLAGALGIDLPAAILAKHEHNAGRAHKHGRLA